MNLDDLKQINNTKGFYVRLRKDLSKSGKIYYGGFKINQESNQKISKSFFKFNSTNIQKSLEKKKSEDLIKQISKCRQEWFDTYKLTQIKFEKSDYAQKNEEKFMAKLNEIQKEFNVKYKNENIIELNFNSVEEEFKILKTLWNIDENGKKNVENCFFKNLKFQEKKRGGKLSVEKVKNLIPSLTKFYEDYTHVEKEKKYQHLFLLNIKNNEENGYLYENIFGKKEITPFEEEYYINYPGGRIDCVFYAVKDNVITDIYLIELKVDDKVLGGTNGIPTHLIDIENIEENSFYNRLLEYINERNELLYSNYIPYKYLKNFNKHFFVIIGRNECEKKDIKSLVSSLNNEESDLYKTVKLKENINNEPINQIVKRLRRKRS